MFRNSAQQQLTDKAHCRSQLAWALHQLDAQPSFADLERYSYVIWSTVSRHTRLFHNAEHILQLSEGGDAIHTLAALFHDAVYVQVDGGLPDPVQDLLKPYLVVQGGELCLQGLGMLRHYRSSAMVAHLFDFQDFSPQPANQHNELLSALLAVDCLEPLLSWGDLAQITVAIEASIPFRAQPQEATPSPAECLFHRLQQANQHFHLQLDDTTITRAIYRAVAFANNDVEGFATADPAIFLERTWRLLPEFNPALRDPMHYSVQDYRQALQGMEIFMGKLDAGSVFQQFRQFPDRATCQHRERRARQNLSVAQLYLQTKVVAIAILEALAPFYQSDHASDRAMAIWMAPRPNEPSWENSFGRWNLSHPLTTVTQSQVLQVAEQGRKGICHFDLSRSPLAAFLIRSIGFQRIHQLRIQADEMFAKRIGPEEFLNQCEAKVVQAITRRLRPLT